MIGGYEQLWKAIIRPPRAEYTINDLGTPSFPQAKKYSKDNPSKFNVKTSRYKISKALYFNVVTINHITDLAKIYHALFIFMEMLVADLKGIFLMI